jgi:hypothetical protein
MLKQIGYLFCAMFAAAAAPLSFTGTPQQTSTAPAQQAQATAGESGERTDEGVPVVCENSAEARSLEKRSRRNRGRLAASELGPFSERAQP